MITATRCGFYFPPEIWLEETLWLSIFHYGLAIPSLGRGICQSQSAIYWHLDSDTVHFVAGTSIQFWLWNGKSFPGNRNPRKEVEIGFYKEHTFSSLHRRRLITARHKDKPIDFKSKFSLPILCLLVTKHAICQPPYGQIFPYKQDTSIETGSIG